MVGQHLWMSDRCDCIGFGDGAVDWGLIFEKYSTGLLLADLMNDRGFNLV
jgi:hypothetical protein